MYTGKMLFAQRLIVQTRKQYAKEDLCLSLFPWARFRKTRAAVKMHTLLDLRGNTPYLTICFYYYLEILNCAPRPHSRDLSWQLLQTL